MDDMVRTTLVATGTSAGTAGAVLAVAWRPWRSDGAAGRGPWWAAAALGLGYAAGHVAAMGWPWAEPSESWKGLPYASLVAGAAGAFGAWRRIPWWTRWPAWGLAAAGGLWFVLQGRLLPAWRGAGEAVWRPGEATAWFAGSAAAVIGVAVAVEGLAARRPGASVPLVIWTVVACAAAALFISGSTRFGQLGGALAGAAGAWVAASAWRPAAAPGRGGGFVALLVLGGLLVCGHVFGELPASCALLLAAAPCAAWAGELGFVRRRAPWPSALLRAAFALVPAAAAVALAVRASPALEY